MAKVFLSVKIEAKKDNRNELLKNLKTLQLLTHQNDRGCLQYDLFVNKETDNIFHLLERWEDENSLAEHKNKKHYLEFLKENENKILSVQIDELNKI